MDESYEESEVFIGPVLEKESIQISKLRRKTELCITPLNCAALSEDSSSAVPSDHFDDALQKKSKCKVKECLDDDKSDSSEILVWEKFGGEMEAEKKADLSEETERNTSMSEDFQCELVNMLEVPVTDSDMLVCPDKQNFKKKNNIVNKGMLKLPDIQSITFSKNLTETDTEIFSCEEPKLKYVLEPANNITTVIPDENVGCKKMNNDSLTTQLVEYKPSEKIESYEQVEKNSDLLPVDDGKLNKHSKEDSFKKNEFSGSEELVFDFNNFEENTQAPMFCEESGKPVEITHPILAKGVNQVTLPLNCESDNMSLKVIDVHDTQIYESFCINDDNDDDKAAQKSPVKKYEKISKENSEVSDTEGCTSFTESSYKIILKTSVASKLEGFHSDYQHTSISQSSSEGYTSLENPNYGMIVSNSESNNSDLFPHVEKPNELNSGNSPSSEICSHFSNLGVSESEKHILSSLEHSFSSSLPSPDRRFNDTVEEMEMLLNHGIEYFKNKDHSFKSTETDHKTQMNNAGHEEFIICPKKEMTISSSNSIHSFNPNLDSTHASMDTRKGGKFENEEQLPVSVKKESEQNFMMENKTSSTHKSLINAVDDPLKNESEQNFKTGNKTSPSPKSPTHMVDDRIMHSTQSSNEVPSPSKSVSVNISKFSDSKGAQLHSPFVRSTPKVHTVNMHTPKYNFHSLKSPATTNVKCSQTKPPNNVLRKPAAKSVTRTPDHWNSSWKSSPSLHPASKTCKFVPTIQQNPHQPFLVPQGKVLLDKGQRNKPQITITRTPQSLKKLRQMNIVSPVARYLQDNPPPPLIATVKPLHRISPHKLLKEVLSPSPTKPHSKVNHDESSVEREATINRNEDGLKRLALKVTSKFPLKEANSPTNQASCTELKFVLPHSVYHQGTAVQLENKENCNRKREIHSDHPPTLFLKHKGRAQISKMTEVTKEELAASAVINRKDSFMEVSVHEPHFVHHTNTLK